MVSGVAPPTRRFFKEGDLAVGGTRDDDPEAAAPGNGVPAVVRGELTESDAIAETRRRTRAYAKRQRTWLRSERNVHWVEATGDRERLLAAALRIIEVER